MQRPRRGETKLRLDVVEKFGAMTIHNRPDLLTVPEEIRAFKNLHTLEIVQCGLTSLPSWLAELPHLHTINVGGNQISTWPAAVNALTGLERLGLAKNRIPGIPADAFKGINRLKSLALGANPIRELPDSVGSLSALEWLDLGDTRLTSLPSDFAYLTRLRHLFAWGTALTGVPEPLRHLHDLLSLDIGRRRRLLTPISEGLVLFRAPARHPSEETTDTVVFDIPEWLWQLPALRYLGLDGRSIPGISPGIGRSSALRELFLANIGLQALPAETAELRELETLDLSNNHLASLPREICGLTKLRRLTLRGNPLPLPPEILDKPRDAGGLISYLQGVEAEQQVLGEAKLLIVGQGAVGKTSLVNRLVHNAFSAQQDKTHGIDVVRWRPQDAATPITLNVWDFGGQEIMHATHQFFLTRRSLYLLVLDARQDEEQNRLEYWLKLIHSFSDGSPVIIVGNKSDQHELDIDRRGLLAKYDTVRHIATVSCAEGTGIDQLRQRIIDTVDQLPHVRDRVPASFIRIKTRIQSSERPYLSYGAFEEICGEEGVMDRASRSLLVQFLHDLGTVVCFREDPRLSDTHVLSPSWATGAVYRIINSHKAAQQRGLLSWPDLYELLDGGEFPHDKVAFIVQLMKKFELCYEDDDRLLIPDLLTKEEPDTGSWDGSLGFIVSYDVLPSSIVSRLIVRCHKQLSHGTMWRTGMVLAFDENRALIKADYEEKRIAVHIAGPDAGRRGLLTAVRSHLRSIEQTIPGLHVEEHVPVPGHPGISVPYRHLIDLEEAGRTTVVPHGLTVDLPIVQLLAGIEVGPKSTPALAEPEPVAAGETSDDVSPEPAAAGIGSAGAGATVLLALALLIGGIIILRQGLDNADKIASVIGGLTGLAGTAITAWTLVRHR